jgi:hypothetical protein
MVGIAGTVPSVSPSHCVCALSCIDLSVLRPADLSVIVVCRTSMEALVHALTLCSLMHDLCFKLELLTSNGFIYLAKRQFGPLVDWSCSRSFLPAQGIDQQYELATTALGFRRSNGLEGQLLATRRIGVGCVWRFLHEQ